MFSFFSRKNKKIKVNIGEFLRQDMHSHIIPGLDDGAPDIETAISLIRGMHEAGISCFMGTPHIMEELYHNNKETIAPAYEALKQGLKEAQLNVQVNYAAEYMVDEGFLAHLRTKRLLTLYDNWVLIETPFYTEPIDMEEVLFQIETAGYKAILAHPERYHYVDDRFKVFEKYIHRGMKLQLNVLSLTGYYGLKEREVANRLLEAGYYQYIGTDLHHERHLNRLSHIELEKKTIQLMEKNNWENHLITEWHSNVQ
ncbi:MAG TPA: CpsB/CapC family capsule biosynthesis tyrosine phosphatase [Edaphocola sp.]|nr:CpsB/CapC family capsule biosynthesis tyrosine phosphatase [Edaphocola sp.]